MIAPLRLPLAARVLVASVVVAGGAVAVSQCVALPSWTVGEVCAFAALAFLVALFERFHIELRLGGERTTYSAGDALWTGALLLAPPSVLLLAVAVGMVVGQGMQPGWAPVKVAFNASQAVVGLALATLVLDAFGRPVAVEPAAWLATALGMAALSAVNTLAMGAVVSLVEGKRFWDVALVPTGILHWSGNVAVGILGAVMWETEPLGLPLVLAPLVLTFAAYRGWLRSVQEQERMQSMTRAAETISAGGDLTKRLPAGGGDGVAALAGTLNRMLDRLDAAFQRERLFINETSHELRTPITICRGHLELTGPDASPEELGQTIDLVVDELDRMARIVQDMGTLARMEDPASLRLDYVPLERLVSDVASKASTILRDRLQVDPPPASACVRADPQRITQALINLLTNASEHTPRGGKVDLRVIGANGHWRFEVADEGGGLAPGQEAKVFRPFFTDKESTGSGLGLAIIDGIARAHGGHAGVDNRPGLGATFWVELPR